MRVTTCLVAAGALLGLGGRLVAAQGSIFPDGLISYLTSLNLTKYVAAGAFIGNTTEGQTLRTLLASGQPLTLLAGSEIAWNGVKPFFSTDPVWVGQALAYQIIPGNISIPNIAIAPENSVYETALKDPTVVHLLGGKPQNIGFVTNSSGTYVTNQNDWPARIEAVNVYQNFLIYTISAVVDLPPQTKDALTSDLFTWTANLTLLAQYAPASIIQAVYNPPSITLFAPNNAAITAALTSGKITAAQITTVILNHIINGTVVFTGHPQANYTSAAGETITVGTGGSFGNVVYYKGSVVADIIHPDIITQNGVLHIIDQVLPETIANATIANSAYSAATKSATATIPAGSPERRRRFVGLF